MQKASRKRVVPTWNPTWSSKIENWTANQIRKNLWRFDAIDGLQDVMQEAQLLFLFTLKKKYPAVNNDSHYFALYKTSLLRMFIDKSRFMNKSVVDKNINAEDVADELKLEGMPNCGFVNLLLEELPDELKLVLQHLTSGRVRLKLDRPPTKTFRKRENHNMRLKRRFTLSTSDPVGDLRAFFANS